MDFSSVFGTVLITIVGLLAYVVYVRYKLFQLFRKLGFSGPIPHFITGNDSDFQSGSEALIISLEKWRQKYGKVFGYYLGTIPTLVIADVDLIKQITIKDFQMFPERWIPKHPTNIFGKSLVFEKGKKWKHLRKTLTPTFSVSKLRHLTPIMKRAVGDFETEIQKLASKEKEFDIYDRFQRLTLDVIGESALAMKINCQQVENNQLYDNAKKFMKTGRRMSALSGLLGWLFAYFPELATLFKFVIRRGPVVKSVLGIVHNLKVVIRSRRSQSGPVKTVDMLQLMLDAADEDKKLIDTSGTSVEPMTDEQLIGNCLVFLLAGFETTATTLGFVAYLLSKHPHVQDKVYQEIQTNVQDVLNVTYEDANNLPYLEQVINETLRLYPPFWALTRINSQEYFIEGKKIPVGMKVEIPIYNIHHDSELWSEPEKFDPERFSPENKGKIHPAAHIPFGIGPRNCIGIRFALLEIKLTLIGLLTKYRLVPSNDSKHSIVERIVPGITYVPKNGIFLKVEPRTVEVNHK